MADTLEQSQQQQHNQQHTQQNKPKKRRRKTRTQRHKEKLASIRPDINREIVKDNDNLVKYYKAQSFLRDNEFQQFIEGLRQTLPASFRINAFDYDQAIFLRNFVQSPQFFDFNSLPIEANCDKHADTDKHDTNSDEQNNYNASGSLEQNQQDTDNNKQQTLTTLAQSTTNKSPALEPLCWYPKQLAWQMNITRVDLKKSPILQQLHKFIMAETDNGFISRQESVSMIPPLLLDVCRGQNLLDMCAAPGSKTAQLLEYLKFDIFDTGLHAKVQTNDLFDDGLVVANDVDNKRCYMLVHQANRLNSPNCVIINEDASRLPNMKTLNDNGELQCIKFDRILCDVPCSGDGTVRKNPDVWRKWTVGNANNFHGMQCKILKRGVELLKEDGLLVYSTCSMNPAENESVIASILRASQGKVVLEDFSDKLKGLKYRPGVNEWVVMGRDMEVISNVDQIKPEQSSQIHPSLFPPSEEEANRFNLHKCIRMLPHLQNTGAFFVAVLRKLSSTLPWEETIEETSLEQANGESKPTRSAPPNPKKRRYGGFKEDPFFFVDIKDLDWIGIKEAYGIKDNFPVNQLVHRCKSGKKRSIYLVSKRTRNFIIANQEEPEKKDFVKIINGGMRLFARAEIEAGFRICQDGVNEILPFVKDDLKVPMNKSDLVALLKSRAVAIDELSSGAHIRDKLKVGSFVLMYKHEEEDKGSFEMPLVAWKGERTVALYVSKTYRVHLCALGQLDEQSLAT